MTNKLRSVTKTCPAPKKFEFKDVDKDGKNGISETELATWLLRVDPKKTKADAQSLFQMLDANKDKKLDEKEFEAINKKNDGGGSGTFASFLD